jgi:PEP-CTERM motif
MTHMLAVRMLAPVVGLLVGAGSALAGPILDSAEVSRDPSTGLYTYTYSLNQLASPLYIGSFEVLVAPGVDRPGLAPVAQSAPADWSFWSSYIPDGDLVLPGFYWGWGGPHHPTGLTSFPDRLSFSFTTASPPGHGTGTNYEIRNKVFVDEPSGPLEVGSTSVPDLAAAPEPSTLALAGAAVAGWAWSRWRSRKRNPAAQAAGPDCPP